MVLKLKQNLNNNQNKGKAMLRLKSAQNTPKAAERQVSREYWEAYRQTQIGLDASLHALYAATDDVSRKKEYLDIMKHVRQAFVKTNAHLGIKTPVDDELLPLPTEPDDSKLPPVPDECFNDKVEVVSARKIHADRVVDMDDLAMELALVVAFEQNRLDSLFKKATKVIQNANTAKETNLDVK